MTIINTCTRFPFTTMPLREENEPRYTLSSMASTMRMTELKSLHLSSMFITHNKASWTAISKLPVWFTARKGRDDHMWLKICQDPNIPRSLSSTLKSYKPLRFEIGDFEYNSSEATIGFSEFYTGKQTNIVRIFESNANLEDGVSTYVNSIVLALDSGFAITVSSTDIMGQVEVHYGDCGFRAAFGYDGFG